MVAWTWPGDRFPPSPFFSLLSQTWEAKDEKSLQVGAIHSFYLFFFPSSTSLLNSQLLYFLPIPSSAGGWGRMGSQSVYTSSFLLLHPVSLFQCGHLHGLHVKTCSNMGSPWTTNHLGNIHCSIVASSVHSGCLLQHGPPMGCRTTPAQSQPLPQAAEDFLLCSSSSSIYTAYVNKLAKMPNHNTYHYIHVL